MSQGSFSAALRFHCRQLRVLSLGLCCVLQVRRLHMYKQRPVRDKKGKVLFEAYQSKAAPSTRIVPDRRWFGNTRVIGACAGVSWPPSVTAAAARKRAACAAELVLSFQ